MVTTHLLFGRISAIVFVLFVSAYFFIALAWDDEDSLLPRPKIWVQLARLHELVSCLSSIAAGFDNFLIGDPNSLHYNNWHYAERHQKAKSSSSLPTAVSWASY